MDAGGRAALQNFPYVYIMFYSSDKHYGFEGYYR
jgi:hypothetical protein